MATPLVRHGSWHFSMMAPSLGEGFQDRILQRPSGGCSLQVLKEVSRGWGGTIPLVARVTEDAAAGLTGGRCSGAPQVRISIGNPGGQRAACCCRETLYPIDLNLGALVYRFGGLTPPNRHHLLLPNAAEDGVSHPPHGASPPLGC